MTADPFGRRVNGHMCAPLERTEKIAAHAEGVIHHHADALTAGHLCNRLIIRDIECRISEIFQIYGLGLFIDECLQVLHLVAFCKPYLNAHVTKGDGKHRECTSVEERLRHDVVSRAADIGDREEYCRLSRSCSHCCHAAFECRHPFLKHLIGGVGDTGVYIARTLEFEKFGAIFHAVEGICRALIYRHCRTL